MSRRGDYNAILRAAKRAGCKVARTGHHVVLVAPNGARVVCSSSPSDVNAGHNLRRDLRKQGVDV